VTSIDPFRWQDGERLIVFGRGTVSSSVDLLGPGYTVLSTPRAIAESPAVADGASAVVVVGPGRVDEIAGAVRGEVSGDLLVALGGGRVIDVAKALAAADPPRRVAAIPTTLSGAEMSVIHRHAAGVPVDTPRVRPAIVINDPALSASQPFAELAQSAGNALAHCAEGPLTPMTNPVASLAALEAARLMGRAFAAGATGDELARDRLALGGLLAGYVIDSTWYGLHHAMSQTLVRFARLGHGAANTIMLPVTIGALARRNPDAIGRLSDALGEDAAAFATRLRTLTGVTSLSAAGMREDAMATCVEEASGRAELAFTPPPADRDELRVLYEAAF